MKIIFAGTPEFAAEALRALIEAGHEIVAVLTQPDRPAGRGMHLQASPVKLLAQEKGIPVWQPLSLNIHASLLPRWRGAAPIARAIEAGDTKTGVAIMKMEAGLDTGPLLISQEVEIHAEETSQSLHDRLAKLGATLMVEALQSIAANKVHFLPQSNDGISYANKLLKTEASINWHTKAQLIDRKVRAFNPFPGASTLFDGELIKIWRTRLPNTGEQELLAAKKAPGSIIGLGADGIWVQCQDQCLEVLELQKSGGKKMSARTWFLANSKSSSKQFLT